MTNFEIAELWLLMFAVVLHCVDWLQTRNIAKTPDRWREKNPILGRHPTLKQVNWWFGTSAAAIMFMFYLSYESQPEIAFAILFFWWAVGSCMTLRNWFLLGIGVR